MRQKGVVAEKPKFENHSGVHKYKTIIFTVFTRITLEALDLVELKDQEINYIN